MADYESRIKKDIIKVEDSSSKLIRSIVLGVVCVFSTYFGLETFENSESTSQNTEQVGENTNSMMKLEWRMDKLESTGTRLCTCVAEDDLTKERRVKACPTLCDTPDAIRQCEGINPGYQCG